MLAVERRGKSGSWGALPLRGHVPPDFRFPREADLAVVGPIARDSGDVRLLWRVLSGATAAPDPQPAIRHPKGLRIALISDQEGLPIHFIGKLLTPVQRLFAKPRVDLNSKLLLLRYMTASHREWQLADSIRWQMIERMHSFFERFDVMFVPVLATWAFPHDQNRNMFARKLMVDGVAYPYYTTLCWIALATALRLPAISVRAGTASDGLPIGIQIVGPARSEERLLDIVAMIEERGGGFTPPSI